jgi:hypothetical protein
MAPVLTPITTHYRGYAFRSRLEARYAVMLDTLGIAYQYEPEGYDLGELGRYLPDFYLPTLTCFAEVKPGVFAPVDFARAAALGGTLLLDGMPRAAYYFYARASATYAQYRGWDAFARVDLAHSQRAGRLWFDYWESMRTGDLISALIPAVTAARSARFEHGERPGYTHTKETR